MVQWCHVEETGILARYVMIPLCGWLLFFFVGLLGEERMCRALRFKDAFWETTSFSSKLKISDSIDMDSCLALVQFSGAVS